jgi:NAD(P)-dependent dehydrogenase (short-subunit alcohol dehydrogenase family)
LGRACEPQDIANTKLFLATEKAPLVAGAVLSVAGAWRCGHTFPIRD